MLTDEKIHQIEHAVTKNMVAHRFKLSDLCDLKRGMGNRIKQLESLGVKATLDEVLEYAENLLREIFEEELKKGMAGKK